MNESSRFFALAIGAALILVIIVSVESQILLRVYGAGNMPTISFFATIIPTCIIFRFSLNKVFDWLDRQAVR